jgi:hypothetical protein
VSLAAENWAISVASSLSFVLMYTVTMQSLYGWSLTIILAYAELVYVLEDIL